MASFKVFLLVYLFGGLTFLPFLLAVAIYATTRPVSTNTQDDTDNDTPTDASVPGTGRVPRSKDKSIYDELVLPGDDVKALKAVRREHARDHASGSGGTRKHKYRQDPADDFATAGYFAVHRKYVAMGGNLRPMERGSSVGSAEVAPPSPSVYQTFFRSMLNKKSDPETVEISNAASPRPKNAHNMFYVVLRHGHLILFDDDQQVDVRHVIKLADHDVKIYSGADVVPEGELFIKRNAIQLEPKNHQRAKAHNAPAPQPWFFYCENCSEKEDFYFSLIRSQENAPQPREIDVRHLTALMERLHASEEAADMRWFNALLGRLFLGVYKTSDVLKFVESKVITKLSRMPRPSFMANIVVQRVDIGETTPQITSPRLKSLTAEGECVIEADVRYTGRFEIDLAATLRVSTPIGQQEVKTSLAVVLTQLEGHMLFKVKGPPSNRIWFTFRHMPKIEMETRPIIMARQLTWTVFTQLIEGKIKEAISESIVLPFWDDTPFFPTEKKAYRGGLWEDKTDSEHEGSAIRTAAAGGVPVETAAGAGAHSKPASSTGVSLNTPDLDEHASPAVLRLRRLSKTHSAPVAAGVSPAALTAAVTAVSGGAANNSLGRPNDRKQRIDKGDDTVVTGASPPKKFPRTSSALASLPEPKSVTDRSLDEAPIQSLSLPKNDKHSNLTTSWLSSGTLRGKKSNASLLDVEGSDSFAPASDSETPVRQSKTSPSTSKAGNDSGSEAGSGRYRSTALPSGRTSSSSLASMVGSGSGSGSGSGKKPQLHRKPSIEPSFTTTITSDGSIPPAKRSAVLAAAMTGAAQSAKRWGMNALQRRAAAAADRKAKANSEQRTTSSGELLDLSKPMGGGMPLPPLGEPLPMPNELALAKDSVSPPPPALPARITPIKRRPTTESMIYGPGGQTPLFAQNSHEPKIKRKVLPSHAPPKQPPRQENFAPGQGQDQPISLNMTTNVARGPLFTFDGQDDMMVVEAPIDSESDVGDEVASTKSSDGERRSPYKPTDADDEAADVAVKLQQLNTLGDESLYEITSPINDASSDLAYEAPANVSEDTGRLSAEKLTGVQDSSAAEDENDIGPDDGQGDAQWDALPVSASAFLDGEDGHASEKRSEGDVTATDAIFEFVNDKDDRGVKEDSPWHSPALSSRSERASVTV
ncbi:hypothetical protein SEPCBS57363_000699 [Sporothrix epigloea]|uniref:SMP-LTD domain-containing protein n=1 Tax=Sporothrix epigloea TaxID=1892477 RepID=A0ABP0D6G0_9PEZI